MNKISLLTCVLLFSFTISAQVWEEQLYKSKNQPTTLEKFNAFEKYRLDIPYTKGNGYKPYARLMDFITKRISNNKPFLQNSQYIEWQKAKNSNIKQSNASNWISLGPINTPIILSNGKKRGNGRVNCIAFDPFDQNIIWVGSPSGGLWKSIDGGSNWTTNTDNLPVMGVSHIAISPTNNQIMYIVTGDAYGTDTYSIGILKSTDGGNNWSTTGLSYNVNQKLTVNKIIINPNYTDSLYAVTNSNIQISSDAGITWQVVLPATSSERWRDIELKPGSPNVIYAAKQKSGVSSIYRSKNGGLDWSIIDIGMTSSRYRPLIAVTPDNPEVIYALFSAYDDGFHGLYKSTNSGDSWIKQSDSPNILGRATDGTSSGGQSWYDLSLAVSTNNENLVYVGGITLWRSDDSGENWEIDASSGSGTSAIGSSYSYMHVDQHAFEFSPHTNIAYAGNDGGLYKYVETLNSWVDISDGLEIAQFYNLGLSKSNSNRVVAGAQDNGTEMLTNSIWDAIRGSDGMECAIDNYDDEIIYSESQYGGIRKSFNGGANWNNIKPVNYDGAWNTPYEIHETNNNLIVIGYNEVYRSNTGGSVWDSISYNVIPGLIRSIALAPSNEDYIYASSYGKIVITKDAGQSWANIKDGLPYENITDITVSQNNADRAWVTFSGYNNVDKVYETNDGGSNWTNVSGNNLPSLPVNCIVYQGGANDDLYIGTDVGVYYKNNTMTNWAPFNNGLPNVIINELEIHYQEGTISAATYGRGLWKSPLNTLSSVESNNITELSFSFFPNPANKKITIRSNKSNINTSIFTLTGKKVFETKLSTINIAGFAKGCYILEVKSNESVMREKLIIR